MYYFCSMDENIDSELLLSLVEDVLGEPRKHNDSQGQISFDCPTCSYDIKGLDDGDGKGNLEVNYYRNVFKCWACSETHGTQGSIYKLVNKWGSASHKKQLSLVMPDTFIKKGEVKYEKVKLPKEYVRFVDASMGLKMTHHYKYAYNYLKKRGITDEIIKKHNIGFCYDGPYQGRIIVPSYDKDLELNFFVARLYGNGFLKYKNPQASKETLIFNEYLIDWDKDIFICEGVFDSLFLPNSIPLLGKFMNDYLWSNLYDNAKGDVIVILDGDAWADAEKLYYKLNGGRLHGRVKVVKLPEDKDIGDLRGEIPEGSILELERGL